MKTKKIVLFFTIIITLGQSYPQKIKKDYPIKPVPFTKVKLTDSFWAPRLTMDHNITIPLAFRKSEETGRVKNFKIAGGLEEGKFCSQYPFDDSDVYKNIEAASYIIQLNHDKKLEAYVDSLIYFIGKAQERDGYLYTNRTIDPKNTHEWAGSERWQHVEGLSHELYNVGHMYEAAVAHYQATGKKSFLNIAIKNADLIDKVFGWGKLERVPGHEVIEMGLVKLYRVTGKEKYLKLAQFFIDKRGKGENQQYGDYAQMHKPFIEQDEAVGHAVRAEYLYSGVTDVAALTGNQEYINALDKIWNDIVNKKIYITGGTGATGGNEGFGLPYDLPNLSAYCETCASVANVFWNQRMFLLKGESKYFDLLERILYNSMLSGISLSGDRFFYPNPLASMGNNQRVEWFGCACCPPNVTRTIASIPGYVYAVGEKGLFVNLFVQNNSEIEFKGQKINVRQTTDYPWNGKVEISVDPIKSSNFSVYIRIPGWALEKPMPGELYNYKEKFDQPVKLFVNGEEQKIVFEKGYAVIKKNWKKDDKIVLDLPMPVRQVVADQKVAADKDRISFQKGPLVYCAEGADNPNQKALNIVIDEDTKCNTEFRQDLLNGIQIIKGTAKGTKRISEEIMEAKEQEFLMIPYYSWANRGPNEMTVWFAEKPELSIPIPFSSIAYTSTISASHKTAALKSIADQLEPSNSNDHSIPYYHWWPKKNSTEWIQYDFAKEEEISISKIYWFDDEPIGGGCRIPESYKLYFLDGSDWKLVNNKNEYKVAKDKLSEIIFDKVKTKGIRIEVKLPENYASGIFEWVIK